LNIGTVNQFTAQFRNAIRTLARPWQANGDLSITHRLEGGSEYPPAHAEKTAIKNMRMHVQVFENL